MDKWIDLHMHSTFSDGSNTPTQLVQLAQAIGLSAISLTDHDTAHGAEELHAAGREAGVETLIGIELSVESRGQTMHMLGYGVDPYDEVLGAALAAIIRGRDERNHKIIHKLQLLGIPITIDEVEAVAGEDVVARPHIAQILIEKGIVANFDEAFDKFLARGAAAYHERFRLDPETAIRLIEQAGGVAALAHPYYSKFVSHEALIGTVRRLKDMGLRGIEVYYSEHSDEQMNFYLEVARTLDLLVTGGTDYHGLIRPGVMMGWGRGNMRIPYEMFEKLKAALKK